MDPQIGSDMLLDSDYDEKRSDGEANDQVAIINPDDDMADSSENSSEPSLPLADDYDAMLKRYMPITHDYEVLEEVHNTWEITNWRTLPRRTTGPVFECGGSPWRILFFPAGNQDGDNCSFYLEQGFGEGGPPENWYSCAEFIIVLHNSNDPSIYLQQGAHHRFTSDEGDWGFTRFAQKNKIFMTNFDGHNRPMVENDSAKVTAYVRVLKDPTGVLWHSFHNYDSKKETGMVGLKNQGATCYLNSLLQSLFLTGAFRKAVYQIPTADEEEKPASNSAYALQRLFYRLQADPLAVSTQELTHSFGWESRQIFEQQDVQELSRILMEKLEKRMKGTEAENALPNMFVGKMKTYLKCINVDYESNRIEDFWDLQLNVSGCKSLDDSFRDYVQVETLEGDNKYQAENFGLQDTKKGVIFESFPDVLHLQLKRFEYDFQRDAMMKVNDRYEFPEIWDASPYLDEKADRSESYIYHLHGVLVHSGDLNAGHYYAYLKPDRDGQFYRFDDDRVYRATRREAIDDNFGGDYGLRPGVKGQNPYTRQWSTKRSNNAYMLVYIRESRLDKIILPSHDMQPPEHLPARIEEERAVAEQKRKEKEEAHLYMLVYVATEDNFRSYTGLDLIPWTTDADEAATPKIYRLLKSMTMADFTTFVAADIKREAGLIRPWIMVNRQNGTIRPDHPMLWNKMTLQEAADKFSTRSAGFRVFMEETTRDSDGAPIWPEDLSVVSSPVVNGHVAQPANKPIILFLKYFDVDQQHLQGRGHIYMNQLDKVQDLSGPIFKLMGWEDKSWALDLFEEIKQSYVEPMKHKQTLHASEIQDGDIICFQRHLEDSEKEVWKQTKPTAVHTAPQYYDFLVNRLYCTFTLKTALPMNVQLKADAEDKFVLALSKKDPYDILAQKVADHLTSICVEPVMPSHLRFTTSHQQNHRPQRVVKRVVGSSVATILLGNSTFSSGYTYTPSQAPDHLYYEVLEMSLADLELRKTVRIHWLTEGIAKDEEVDILAHKQATFSTVLDALAKRLELPTEIVEQIRFYEAHQHKVYKVLPLTHGVVALNEFMTVYAERVPQEERDELDAERGDRLVNCFHFEKEPRAGHGVPFVFVLKEGEIFRETKERLSKRTGIKGKNFEKVRFAIIKNGATYGRPMWIEDDDILSEKLVSPDDQLGLEHPNRARGGALRYETLNIR